MTHEFFPHSLFIASGVPVENLRVRSNTSSRTGIGGGAKFYSVRLVVVAVLPSELE